MVSNEYEPVAPKNMHLLVAGRDAVPNFLRVCMMSSGKMLAERGDDAVHFLAAEMNALRFALSHRDETVALTQRDHPRQAGRSAPGLRLRRRGRASRRRPDLPLPMDKFAWMQEQMVKAGKLKAARPENRHRAGSIARRRSSLSGT